MMKKCQALTAIIISALFASALTAQTEDKSLSLSLEECILRAMKNNLAVAVQVISPDVAMESVSLAQEKFYPSLSFSFNKQSTNSASYSFLDASESVRTKYDQYRGQVSQYVPFGGTLTLYLDNYRNDSTQSFQTINPRFGSTLRFNFSQPLLRDFGYNLSRREILIARNNLDISEGQLEQTLLDTIYSVEDAYWNLVYSIQNLAVRRQSLDLARDLLEKNKRSVEIGTLAPIEILNAQAEVATREADIIAAEVQVKSSEDQLKVLINLSPEEEKAALSVLPADQPTFEERSAKVEDALAVALQNRPDLRVTRIGLKNQELNLNYARNQLLPGLSLNASYWSPGISGDRILYENDNPLTGKQIGVIPGGFSNAFKDAVDFKYKNWSVGLTLDIPLGNVFSRATYAQARLNMAQATLSLQNQEQQVFLEIKNAVRAVESNYKRIQAYKVARELAEQKLAAEEEKLKVGLSTNFLVLTYQRDLANARSSELRAVVDYNLSLALLEKSLGTTLKSKNIRIEDIRR